MRDHILLYVNGNRHEVRGPAVFQPLSTFLRDTLGLTGTKIVCAEGDCGSCTVLLGRPALPSLHSPDDSLAHRPVCSCIQYLCQLDATHIITVEGLAYDGIGGEPNPLQQAFIQHHGAQCGFCTPGFIVAGCSLLDETPKPTEAQLRRALVGNLCRCTGYEPILKAGMNVDAAKLRKINSLFDTPTIAAALAAAESQSVRIEIGHKLLLKPATLADALDMKAANPHALLLAGGTDLGVIANKGKRDFVTVISLSGIRDLRSIAVTSNAIIAHACCPLTDLENAAAAALPEYAKMLDRFGSPPIRNAGTIGGNLANGSPIGDSMPGLFALNASVELASSRGTRQININHFYTGYRKTVMTPEELITRIHIPLPSPGEIFRAYKVSKRLDLDISTFAAAIWMRLSPQSSAPGGGSPVIDDIRIAFNGVAPVILRMTKTEAALKGQPPTEETFANAGKIAREEITPISDVRGNADYRSQLAENTLLRFYSDIANQLPTSV